MQRILATLTPEHQSVVGAIGFRSIATTRACLTGKVGIYFDRHGSLQDGLEGNHALQCSKTPFGVVSIGFALLGAGCFAFASEGAVSNARQVLQSDHGMRMLIHDALAHHMKGTPHSAAWLKPGASCGGFGEIAETESVKLALS